MKYKLIIIASLLSFVGNAQVKYYNYNFYEGKNYFFTMSQSNDLMLNSIRYLGGQINSSITTKKQEKLYSGGLIVFTSLIGQAITHETGHKSVLSELDIGSISKPIIDKNFVAKVTGVSDETLIGLRNNQLPNYIRLHTAGLESDYDYLRKSDMYFNFNEENYQILYPDYFMRKLGSEFYYLMSLYKLKNKIIETDRKERDRDIVGHDIYGMVRHLHRPDMEFYRYTQREDLTKEEKSYADRIAYVSLLNFLNPNIWKLGNFQFSKEVKGNFSINYSLAPFGDFVEQNAYLTIKEKYKLNPYLRQYFNKNYTFLAGGVALHNYSFQNDRFLLNSSLDFWEQPKDLKFQTKDNELGFGLKSELAMRFSNSANNNDGTGYFNLGMSYKTKGFIPGAPSLDDDFQLHLGIIFSLKSKS